MRYFLVTYESGTEDGKSETRGNLWFNSERFPSNEFMKKVAGDHMQDHFRPVVITNIFEFKNKTDFEDFRKTEES